MEIAYYNLETGTNNLYHNLIVVLVRANNLEIDIYKLICSKKTEINIYPISLG